MEFGFELIWNIPRFYGEYLKGNLKSTLSYKDSECFYYFSENHTTTEAIRNGNGGITWAKLLKSDLSDWVPPPYKEHYKNDTFVFDKPILVIANKYNTEWTNEPINFIPIPVLTKLIDTLKDKYFIVYNRPRLGLDVVNDGSTATRNLGDFEFLEERPEVVTIQDLQKEFGIKSYNLTQCMIYANCNHFISVQGGGGLFASYFGGTNILYATKGMEIDLGVYPDFLEKFSGAKIIHTKDHQGLLKAVEEQYV